MIRPLSSRIARPLLALTALAISACGEHRNPTQPQPPDVSSLIICDEFAGCGGGGDGGGSEPPPPSYTVKSVSTGPNRAEVNYGPGVSYSATVYNTLTTRSNVSVQGFVVQGTARRAATPLGFIQCSGFTTGTLPAGIDCRISGTFFASNANNGSGTLIPGSANFEIQVLSSGTLLAFKSVAVTLAPGISGFTLQSSTIDLAGTSDQYSVSLQNTGPSLTNVAVSARVIQGSAIRSAGISQSVSCGLSLGTLPTGTCSISATASVTNTTAGTGILAPGGATFEVSLSQGLTVLATRTVPVTLVEIPPRIAALTLGSSSLLIGGASQSFSATFSNTGASRSSISYQGFIRQGSARHTSTGSSVDCGSGAGVLPNGTCTISSTYAASNTAPGAGTLVPGAAIFEFELRDGTGKMLDSTSVNVTLIAPPAIASLTASNPAVGGPAVAYTATIQNPGPAITGVSAQATTQGAASGDAGSLSVSCGAATGTLPNGTCTFAGSYAETNGGAGTGTLTPGAATLAVLLIDGNTLAVLATRSVPVTLQ